MTTMRSILPVLSLAALLGHWSLAEAQRPFAWVHTPQAQSTASVQNGAFVSLLGQASALGLTTDQVSRIQQVQRDLVRDNERLLAQIRDVELYGVQPGEEEAMAIVRERFQENTGAAEARVEEVLTAEQRARLPELLGDVTLAYGLARGEELTGTEAVDQTASAARPEPPPTRIIVENQNFLDMNVYVYIDSRRQRLGFVTGLTSQTFTLPSRMIFASSVLYFLVQPIGRSSPPESDGVLVHPGDEVMVRIPPF